MEPLNIVASGGHRRGELERLRESCAWADLGERARALGFDHWTFTAVPVCAGPCPLGPTRVSTYPRAYVEECAGRGLYDANPGFAYAMRNDAPIYYGKVRSYVPHTARVRSYLDLNQRFDMTRGILVPLGGVLGARSLLGLAFAGSARELDALWYDARGPVLEMAAELNRAVLHEHLHTFATGLLPGLPARQRELLRLLVEGVSVGAAADRMRISIHTADKHVAAAKRTLHAQTTAQAVALAVRFGMLE